MMRMVLLAAMLAASTTALAADPPPVRAGEMLRDAKNVRLGSIDDVNADGTVDLIIESQVVHVPLASIKVVDGKAVTSMTKDQLLTK